MSEPETPPPPPKDGPPPGPPPEPPQKSTSTPPPPAAPQSTNTVMVVLSYLWILALVPLLVEKDDKEVQWHAKHGLVLLGAEIIVWIALTILVQLPILGVLGCLVGPLLWLAFLVVHVLCIVKGVGGGRFTVPYVSQYADKF